MRFKKLTVKNVLTCTLLLLTFSIFCLTFLSPTVVAEDSSIFPPPPAVADTITVTSTGSSINPDSSEGQVTILEIIIIVIANLT